MMKNEMRSPDYTQHTGSCSPGCAPLKLNAPVGRKRKSKVIRGQFSFFDTGVEGITIFVNDSHSPKKKPDGNQEKRINENWKQLVNENEGLVISRLPRIKGVNADNRADVLQEGRMGLIRAARSFDASLGFQFSSFAVPAIKNAMVREVQRYYGKLDTVSIEELAEENNRAIAQVVEPDSTPVQMLETGEIIDMLYGIAENQRREKEKKGILALAMRLQGYDNDTIIHKTNVKKISLSSVVSTGRRLLQRHPQFHSYLSMLRDEVHEDVVANLQGSDFPIRYKKDVVFDVPSDGANARDYLEVLACVIHREDVSEILLSDVRIGDTAYLIDGDNGCTNTLEMGLDVIEVRRVKKINWRPLRCVA